MFLDLFISSNAYNIITLNIIDIQSIVLRNYKSLFNIRF